MVEIKLSNIVVGDISIEEAERLLYYRADGRVASLFPLDTHMGYGLSLTGSVDFFTYLNSCSIRKWKRYAGIDQVSLHLELEGEGEIIVDSVICGECNRSELLRFPFSGCGEQVVQINCRNCDAIGFSIVPTNGEIVKFYSGYFATTVDEGTLNPVRIAVATTTFNNEQYILPNIELTKAGVIREGGKLAEGFHLFVVDNGRSLDFEALSDEMVTVIPNPNVGGSGGFARGMIAAAESPMDFTHVILMDDDVRILPESFVRTFALLSLAKGKYVNAFVQGAMLSLEEPTRQFEDVARVFRSGVYRRVKGDFNMGDFDAILENERMDVELPLAYGAWWFDCIPLKAIRENGYPIPFFVRCDDVEFGVRNKPIYMVMNGICVWHASFEGRFRASVDCYQYQRNFLAMIAMHECASERAFVLRIRRTVRQNLRDLDYSAAELTLDGFEDYLKGPGYLAQVDGSALMKMNGLRNEKLEPVSSLNKDLLHRAGVSDSVLSDVDHVDKASMLLKLLRTLPYDKHYLPDFITRHRVGYVVKNGSSTLCGSSLCCGTLIYINPTRELGSIRHIDRERFRSIIKRERRLVRQYKIERNEVRQAWRSAYKRFTTKEFWIEYLKKSANQSLA